MRRSLPATSQAVRHARSTHAPLQRPGRPRPRRTRVASEPARSSSWLATITVAPDAAAWRSDGVELVAAVGVEAGVRLVEQPQLGTAGDQAGERGAPLLAGREPAHREHREATGQPEALHRRRRPRRRWRRPSAPQKRTFSRHRQVEVEAVAVAEQRRPGGAPRRAAWRGRSRAPCPVPRASGSSPAHSRSSVVLPAPFGPRSSTISPRRTASEAPASAGKPPSTATASTQLDHRRVARRCSGAVHRPGDATGAPGSAPRPVAHRYRCRPWRGPHGGTARPPPRDCAGGCACWARCSSPPGC